MGHANDFVTGKKVWQLNYKVSGFGLHRSKETAVTAAVNSGQILGNKRSKLYHLSHCSGFTQVSERNQQWFESEQQALEAGFKRAGNCSAGSAIGAED